jgi:hypothetical protein
MMCGPSCPTTSIQKAVVVMTGERSLLMVSPKNEEHLCVCWRGGGLCHHFLSLQQDRGKAWSLHVVTADSRRIGLAVTRIWTKNGRHSHFLGTAPTWRHGMVGAAFCRCSSVLRLPKSDCTCVSCHQRVLWCCCSKDW